MALSAPELIREAIDALMRADAACLEHLAEQVPAVTPPVDACERHRAMAEQRSLGRLLALTRRNLRVLGCDPAGSVPYSLRRG